MALRFAQRFGVSMPSVRAVVVAAGFSLVASGACAETLDWAYPGVDTSISGTPSNTVVNGVTITSSASTSGTLTSNNATIRPAFTNNGAAAGIVEVRMDATTDNSSASQTMQITFSEPVYNLSFIVRDIDGGTTWAGAWNDMVVFNSDNGRPTGVPAAGVAYNATTGQATSTSNTNTTTASGNVAVTYAGPVTSVTIQHVSIDATGTDPAGQVVYVDDLTFQRSPRLTVQKSYTGGTGSNTFNFNVSNSGAGTTATSVTTTGPAATGTATRLNQINIATTIMETGPAGWVISPASSTCTDSNAAASGNPASFAATVVGNVVTVAATNIRAGAVITCALANARLPTVQIRKTTTNGIGTFNFSGTNGFDPQSLATAVVGTPVSGVVQSLDAAGIVTTVTEAFPDTGWTATSATCTGTAAGNVSFNTTTRELTLNATATAVNTDLVCTFTNNDVAPRLTLAKTVTNDHGGTAAASSFNLAAAGITPVSGAAGSGAVTSQRVVAGTYTLSETGPSGYAASAWVCPGEVVTGGNSIGLSNGETRTCTINNNDIAPTLQLRKISNGGVSTFNFAGNNGFGSDAINTTPAGAGNPQVGVVKTLTSGGVATDITETVAAGYFISAVPTCTGMGSGGSISLLSGTTYRLNTAALPIGATVVCTFVNTLAAPQVAVAKSTPTASVNAAGQIVTYTIAVSNPGNVPVSAITVTDPLGTVVCPTSGNNTIATLAVGATQNCTLTYTVPQAVLNSNGGGDGDIDNTATAAGTYNAAPVSGSGSAAVAIVSNPLLTVLKSWAFAPGGDANGNGIADRNDTIRYTYRITNNGNLTINNVAVADVHEGAPIPPALVVNEQIVPGGSGLSTDAVANNGVWSVLQPGDAVTFNHNHTVTQAEVDNG